MAISRCCAQRLTASEVKALASIKIKKGEKLSAQRLTASEVKALIFTNYLNRWHFKCSTPYGIRGKSTCYSDG